MAALYLIIGRLNNGTSIEEKSIFSDYIREETREAKRWEQRNH